MRVGPASWSVFTGRLRKHLFAASVITFTNSPPFDPRPLYHSTSGAAGRNFGLFADERTDALLDTLAVTQVPQRRRELAQELSERLAAEQPVTFTFRPHRSVLLRDTIRGVRIRDGWIDERFLWLAPGDGGRP
jgi:ABC-type transport system substrate-binding protein